MFRRQSPAAEPGDLRLVVGLGNIGRAYAHTRHNVGFQVADEVARRHNARFRAGRFKGEQAFIRVEDQRALLLKPHTLMNLSGESVAAAARFYKIPPAHVLIVCDDVNLPVGRIRLRAGGSDGGHNGLWSVIHRLGTQDFPRLRVGIGAVPPDMSMTDYVLGHFAPDERAALTEAAVMAAQAVETWIEDGLEAAMNLWNAAIAPSALPAAPPAEREQ